ncbi:MAG: DUF1080 domain-containing protein [Verrucomicrobiota bacterium]
MKTVIAYWLLLLTSCTLLLAEEASEELLSKGDFSKFKAETTSGWEFTNEVKAVSGEKALAYEATDEGPILVNGKTKQKASYLFTKKEYRDLRIELEFMVPKGSNSGVYVMGRYEIQILDSYGKKEPKFSGLGGLYQRWKTEGPKEQRGFEGVAPKVNAAKAPGQWQILEITFKAPRFDSSGKKIGPAQFIEVLVNGELVHENQAALGPTRSAQFTDEKKTGPVVIQGDHGPLAIRKLTITPLSL